MPLPRSISWPNKLSVEESLPQQAEFGGGWLAFEFSADEVRVFRISRCSLVLLLLDCTHFDLAITPNGCLCLLLVLPSPLPLLAIPTYKPDDAWCASCGQNMVNECSTVASFPAQL